jgi:hypothetical protein
MEREEEIKQASEFITGDYYDPTLEIRGFVEGAEWADAHPHWISTDEQQPPYNEKVLLYSEGWQAPHIGEFGKVCGKDRYIREDNTFIWDKITRWMPLPDLSKRGE